MALDGPPHDMPGGHSGRQSLIHICYVVPAVARQASRKLYFNAPVRSWPYMRFKSVPFEAIRLSCSHICTNEVFIVVLMFRASDRGDAGPEHVLTFYRGRGDILQGNFAVVLQEILRGTGLSRGDSVGEP
jgi:hypothetical protein